MWLVLIYIVGLQWSITLIKKTSVKISKKFYEPEKLKNATDEKRGIEIRSDTSVPSFLPRECIAKSTEMLYLTLYLPCFSASRANVLNETPMKRCCQKHLISLWIHDALKQVYQLKILDLYWSQWCSNEKFRLMKSFPNTSNTTRLRVLYGGVSL